MRKTFLEQNPFYILEVSPNEKRASIISKAEEKAFFSDSNECEEADTDASRSSGVVLHARCGATRFSYQRRQGWGAALCRHRQGQPHPRFFVLRLPQLGRADSRCRGGLHPLAVGR